LLGKKNARSRVTQRKIRGDSKFFLSPERKKIRDSVCQGKQTNEREDQCPPIREETSESRKARDKRFATLGKRGTIRRGQRDQKKIIKKD